MHLKANMTLNTTELKKIHMVAERTKAADSILVNHKCMNTKTLLQGSLAAEMVLN